MKIKICGLFRSDDIEYVNEALPDYIGFVFAKSRRQVSPEKAAELRRMLSPDIRAVGVFVNADIDFISDLVHNNIIDVVQLHGSEAPEFAEELRKHMPKGTPIIKAFPVSCSEDIAAAKAFPCDHILLDNGKGGTGKTFSWELLKDKMPDNIFLAGGIGIENIDDAVRLRPYCVDVSSGAETNGVKDREKIIKLVQTVRNAP